MIIYDVLQHYYDKQCSHKLWSFLLMSLLVENNGGAGAFLALRQSNKKGCCKRRDIC